MLPTIRSSSSSIISENGERTAFIQALADWVMASPYNERDARRTFNDQITTAFDQALTEFAFEGNISSLPACIGDLRSLKTLDLQGCRQLASLPPEIGNLHNLERLDLRGCGALAALPPQIGDLQNLLYLDLSECQALVVPPDIGRLQNLAHLDLYDVPSFSFEIRNLSNLRYLDISAIHLNNEEFIELLSQGTLNDLEWLTFNAFRLDSIPSVIGNLRNLQFLRIERCDRLISLPPEIGNLVNLTDFVLAGCPNFTTLPPEIGNLRQVQIEMHNTPSLTVLPLEIGNLPLNKKIYIEDSSPNLDLLPVETISLTDLVPIEYETFIETFNRFIEFLSDEGEFIEKESLITAPGASRPTHASGRFVSAFKDRMLAKRLKSMEQEYQRATDALVSLQEDPAVSDLEKYDARGTALPLLVLECFVAQDARVRCLWRQQEQDDRLGRAALASTQP